MNENETGLLEYLEDIIGTNRYKKPLQQLNKCVESLNEERTEKHNRCKLAEREMKDLQKPMTDAVHFLELENDLFRSQNLQAQKYISTYKKQIADGETQLNSITQKMQEHDSKYESIISKKKELDVLFSAHVKNKEINSQQKAKAENKFKQLEKDQRNIHETMKSTNTRRKQLKANLEKEILKRDDLIKHSTKKKTELNECELSIEKLNEKKKNLQKSLDKNLSTFRIEVKDFQENKEKLQENLVQLKKVLDKDKSNLQIAESELEICKHYETSEARKLNTLQHDVAESKNSIEEKKQRLENLKLEISVTAQNLQRYQDKLSQNRNDEQACLDELKTLRTKVSTASFFSSNISSDFHQFIDIV